MKKIVSMLLSVVMLCSVTAGLNLTAYAAETGDWSDTSSIVMMRIPVS